jgi:altronate hydrolase
VIAGEKEISEKRSEAMSKVLRIDAKDNALIALSDLARGESLIFEGEDYTLRTPVPAKHKFVTRDLDVRDKVIMYGVTVGRASHPIAKGEALTTQNLQHDTSKYHGWSGSYRWTPPDVDIWADRTFDGYYRADGQVGTRNYWLVVPLVFCENHNIERLREALEDGLGYGQPSMYREGVTELIRLYKAGQLQTAKPDYARAVNPDHNGERLFKNIDGVKFLIHQGGCGGTREDAEGLCGLLAGYMHNPNVAGATVLSLGCQHAQDVMLFDELRRREPQFSKPVLLFEQQKSGTEATLLADAIYQTFLALAEANKITRKPASIRYLTVGLKCGGSDGFSGITANPALGYVSDVLAVVGARTILSEFPELNGVEQSLIDRCQVPELGERFAKLMRDYAARAKAVRSGFEFNPSAGNIRDGLITDAMKSAGAARKSGSSPIQGVIDYPAYATANGLNLLCTPGNDVECVTAQAAAGATVVLFTTGLGTPTGNPITPVVKVSTNSQLAARMEDIIDIDTGTILTSGENIIQAGDRILEFVIDVAGGRKRTKAEAHGQNDFIPWKRGVSL